MVIDPIDREILRLLLKDSLQSYKELAAQLKMSATPIYERIKKMEAAGIIRNYTVNLNYTEIDQFILILCFISLKDHTTKSLKLFEDTVRQIPEVCDCYLVSGVYDYQLKVFVKSIDEYQTFLGKLAIMEIIADTNTFLPLRRVVDNRPLPI
jgi:Lrp/AsnC family transcriptional regulator, leucine-responsive regulatory protein